MTPFSIPIAIIIALVIAIVAVALTKISEIKKISKEGTEVEFSLNLDKIFSVTVKTKGKARLIQTAVAAVLFALVFVIVVYASTFLK